MAPGIAFDVLASEKQPIRVLDPMMGSGTVLALARSEAHKAIGVDIDPLAVLISRVWTTAIEPTKVRNRASKVIERARAVFSNLSSRNAYPRNADQTTKEFLRYWFDDHARRQLCSLATAIDRVHDDAVRNVLWCSFSRLIIAKQAGASLALDLAHSRPHKAFERAPTKPFRKFLWNVEHVVENCVSKDTVKRGPPPATHEGDARCLPVQSATIDLVLTSPPYLNAIDYFRCSKFSLTWMGHTIDELRSTRARSVGAERGSRADRQDGDVRAIISELNLKPRLSERHEGMVARYIDDMRAALREVTRILAPGGKAVYVIGENTIRGTYVRNSLIVSRIAELEGLRLRDRRSRALPANRRYLPPPSRNSGATLDTRMRREVILTFHKASRT